MRRPRPAIGARARSEEVRTQPQAAAVPRLVGAGRLSHDRGCGLQTDLRRRVRFAFDELKYNR